MSKQLPEQPLPRIQPRPANCHKGDFGRLLVVGGSPGMAGAPALTGMAALRSGAGLVSVAVPASVQATVASYCPAYMTVGLDSDPLAELLPLAEAADVVAIGPGLGRSPAVQQSVLKLYGELSRPLVVDADGLNALVGHTDLLTSPPAPRILTPHPGEFARLACVEPTDDSDVRANAACKFASKDATGQTIVVLKGRRSVVATANEFVLNTTGNPGMATGGSGDCLTGIVAALLGQGLEPFAAARLATHVHGLAGDLARDALGEISMIASDIVEYLPAAFRQL